MILKTIFFAMAASPINAAGSGVAGRIHAGCMPGRACAPRCPNATALQAAAFLVNNICTIIENKDLNDAQSLVTANTTAQFVLSKGVISVDSGVQPILNLLISRVPLLACPSTPSIVYSYVDQNDRETVLTQSTIPDLWRDVDFGVRCTFEPVGASCEYRLINVVMRQDDCAQGAY